MGRCVIFALGEILIAVLSAATWMDEPGSLQPQLTFPQHLRQTSRSHGGHSDACDHQEIFFLSSTLIYLVTLNFMQLLPKWNRVWLQEMVWYITGLWVFINVYIYKYVDFKLSSQETT